MYTQDERPMENYSGQKDLLSHETPIFILENYAGFWLRAAAYIIDGIVAYIFILVFSLISGLGITGFSGSESEPGFTFWGSLGLIYIGIFLYFPLMESSKWQATFGKRAVGIIVTDLDGRRITFLKALGRLFAKFLSSLILYIGFIMVGFTERKQGLHDIICSTLVIKGNAII